ARLVRVTLRESKRAVEKGLRHARAGPHVEQRDGSRPQGLLSIVKIALAHTQIEPMKGYHTAGIILRAQHSALEDLVEFFETASQAQISPTPDLLLNLTDRRGDGAQ